MEKAVLLIENSGEHLRCLLNPERLELRRNSGVVARRSLGGTIAGSGLSDDPLLFCGGGQTELTLELLFDVSLAVRGPDVPPLDDIRELTGPLWDLAETATSGECYGRPPIVRFLWGTGWNIPCVVAAVAERLEKFTCDGKPQRSWLRLRLLRIVVGLEPEPSELTPPIFNLEEARLCLAGREMAIHEQVGGDCGERLDKIAAEHFGHPGYWRLLAEINDLEDPLRLSNCKLQVPVDLSEFSGGRK